MQALTSASKEGSERPRTSGNSVCRVQHSEGGVKSKLLITAISFPWIFRASASYCSELRFPSTSVAGVFRSACRAASCGSMLFFQLRVRSLQLGVWFSHADFELVAVNEGKRARRFVGYPRPILSEATGSGPHADTITGKTGAAEFDLLRSKSRELEAVLAPGRGRRKSTTSDVSISGSNF